MPEETPTSTRRYHPDTMSVQLARQRKYTEDNITNPRDHRNPDKSLPRSKSPRCGRPNWTSWHELTRTSGRPFTSDSRSHCSRVIVHRAAAGADGHPAGDQGSPDGPDVAESGDDRAARRAAPTGRTVRISVLGTQFSCPFSFQSVGAAFWRAGTSNAAPTPLARRAGARSSSRLDEVRAQVGLHSDSRAHLIDPTEVAGRAALRR